MKTFKQLVNEVAEPRGGDEKRFKAKHVTAKYDHPAAEEDQFTAKTNKKKRLADHEKGKDEEVYEAAQPKWKVAIGKKHYNVVGRNTAEASRKAKMMADKEGNYGVPGKVERMAEEVELNEEKWLITWKKKNTGNDGREWMDASKFFPTEREARLFKGQLKHSSTVLRNSPKMRKIKEEVELDEAFKMGSMKLKDGKTVKLSKEEAEAVNELFKELNSSNKKRMQDEMTKNKAGFDKVLKFAKEAM